MTTKPDYVTHTVDEKAVTVDWFFGKGRNGTKAKQLALILVGWVFAILPVVVTVSALANRDNPDKGWWDYTEGFALWDTTVKLLGVLLIVILVLFFVLFLANRASTKRLHDRAAYNEERLAKRLELAEQMYVEKFGPPELRQQQARVQIQPYADIETFELRGLYGTYGAE